MRRKIALQRHDTLGRLHARAAELSGMLLSSVLARVVAGEQISALPQQREGAVPLHSPALAPGDGAHPGAQGFTSSRPRGPRSAVDMDAGNRILKHKSCEPEEGSHEGTGQGTAAA